MSQRQGNAAPVIVIKKKSGGGHGGHHGGAWKVAYADFVTAMMAFFLLLWLLNVTTQDQKKAIANYFDPTSVSDTESGSGGVMGGTSMLSEGAQVSESKPVGVSIPLPGDPATDNGKGERSKDPSGHTENAGASGKLDKDNAGNTGTLDKDGAGAAASVAAAKADDKNFKEVEASIRQAIQSAPELQTLAQNLLVDQTPEGLRIQMVDQEGTAMFQSGKADMGERTRKLMQAVAKIVAKTSNQITIRGHTDSTPMGGGKGYNNWDLSTDRANAVRRALMEDGLDPSKIASVVGKADREPLFRENPAAPENRRISIVMLRSGATADTGDSALVPEGRH